MAAISASPPRVHAAYIGGDSLIGKCFGDLAAGGAGAYKMMVGEELGVVKSPLDHVGFTPVVRYERNV